MSDRLADEAFDDLRPLIEDPTNYPEGAIGIHIELVPQVLAPERTRLIAELQRNGPAESVEGLAKRLGRNYASVSRDVSHLSADFLVTEQVGHRKRIRASERPIVVTGARLATPPH